MKGPRGAKWENTLHAWRYGMKCVGAHKSDMCPLCLATLIHDKYLIWMVASVITERQWMVAWSFSEG